MTLSSIEPMARYRISEIVIEGFRGFTAPQTINVGGKHLFIFGANGSGKSSIVEAIRWCLFGSASNDIEFRNAFYESQECRVRLLLKGQYGELSVERELRPEHERARQTIRDVTNGGKVVAQAAALPRLARMGNSESAQVIFAGQHASGRQVPANISDFGTVMCFYLGLEMVKELSTSLRGLHEEYSEVSTDLSRLVEQREQVFRKQLEAANAQLSTCLEDPPWGDGALPTGFETDEKVARFIREAGNYFGQISVAGPDSETSLNAVQRCVEDFTHRDAAGDQREREIAKERLGDVERLLVSVRHARSLLEACEKTRDELWLKREDALARETSESLRAQLELLIRQDERQSLAERAAELCAAASMQACPVCGTHFGGKALLIAIEARRTASREDSAAIAELRSRLGKIETLDAQVQGLMDQVLELSADLNAANAQLTEGIGSDAVFNVELAEAFAAQLRRDVESLDRRMSNNMAEAARWSSRIRELRQELRFHDVRDKKMKAEARLEQGMAEAHSALRDYRDLLARIDEISQVITRCFGEALDRAIPTLDDMLTGVYQRLTRQASYSLVKIYHDHEKVGDLELRVASDRLDGRTFPVNVLNGQAAKALHLVPYFVFSRFRPQIMELDLLLIDDPSESFDTSRVELLVQEFATVGEHAQLVVASHEREKFEPYVLPTLPANSFNVLAVNSFNPVDGPRIVRE